MELDPEVSGDRAPSSVTSSPNSIVDRKRELKAIPGSFSYNLGRRSGATVGLASGSSHHSPNRSVRSIVAWIESSSAGHVSQRSSGLSTSDDGSATTIRSTASSYKLHGGLLAAQSSPPPPPPPPRPHDLGVDNDCPTFLDYQRYFARGSSLTRCLDEQPPVSGAEMDKERREAALRHHEQERRGSRRGRLFTGGEREKRSPAEVAALWNSVRQQLWIPDEELESDTSDSSFALADEGSVPMI
ncbi:hypothetical protein ISF_01968 [Cordyceps fumosorosea ARSEF 2679]|uniref:Uncharacterized protein n=1 Tax=Cordyceps fumosorosea (strain ARSEF 2679) TaxID=1081104 RepID=A0A168CIH6_CORFA|nr:hypothetical protein ISF_01968 [Cordyceps fumosorosea ARSEF 2679]OAA71417.1 hypothetical protein ISF_01968 [Cordyceps fumosorosea ARSEF 2679]